MNTHLQSTCLALMGQCCCRSSRGVNRIDLSIVKILRQARLFSRSKHRGLSVVHRMRRPWRSRHTCPGACAEQAMPTRGTLLLPALPLRSPRFSPDSLEERLTACGYGARLCCILRKARLCVFSAQCLPARSVERGCDYKGAWASAAAHAVSCRASPPCGASIFCPRRLRAAAVERNLPV